MADLLSGVTTPQAPLLLMPPPAPHLRDGVQGRNAQALGWLADWMGASDSAPRDAMLARESAALSLLLWGAAGAGKTFWIQAWAAEGHGLKVFDLQDPRDAAILQTAIGSPDAPRLWLIDNIDAADAETQQALFALFIVMQQTRDTQAPGSHAPHRLVATARAAPGQLVGVLRDDLRTRLGQGLVFELHELDDAEKLQALRDRAFRLGWMAAPSANDYDHLFTYMLARLPRQLGSLMRLLEMLDARALSLKRAVTLPLMRSLLDENLSLF